MNLTAPVITRNDVTKTFTPAIFGKKAKTAGAEFFYFGVTAATLESDIAFIGVSDTADILDKVMRNIGAGIYLDHYTDDNGVLVPEKFNDATVYDAYKLDLKDFTAGVAKLSDLQEQVDNLQDQNSALLDKSGADDTSDEDAENYTKQILANNATIKPLRAKIKDIQQRYAQRALARKAKEQASPTRSA